MKTIFSLIFVTNIVAPVTLNQLAVKHVWLEVSTIFFAQYVPYILIAIFVSYTVLLRNKAKNILVVFITSAVVLRFLLLPIIHLFIQTSRPFTDPDDYITPLVNASGYSFPSSHAMIFFALATVVYMNNRFVGIIFFTLAFLIGVARVFAGVHYPFDIVAGGLLGVVVPYIISKFIPLKLQTKWNTK